MFKTVTKGKNIIYLFFGGGQDSNPGPCLFYALFIPTELSSRGHVWYGLCKNGLNFDIYSFLVHSKKNILFTKKKSKK